MTALQKSVPGTPPKATDGDTVRTFQARYNAAVDVLNTQATLTSVAAGLRDLTAADMGKRVNMTPTAAGTCHFEAAANCGADQIVSIHNLSPAYDVTMAVKTGSGDTPPTVVVIKPGECNTYETDGASVYRTVGRKKPLDETVQGKLSVAGAYSGASAAYTGNVTVGGTIGVTGDATLSGKLVVTGDATLSGAATVKGNATVGGTFGVTGATTLSGTVAVGGVMKYSAAPAYVSTAVAQGAFTAVAGGKAFAIATSSGNALANGNTNIAWTSIVARSPASCFDGTSFIAPVAGWYRFSVAIQVASGLASGNFVEIRLMSQAGGIISRTIGYTYNSASLYQLELDFIANIAAGSTAYIQVACSAGWALANDSTVNRLSVEQVA